MSLLDSIRHLFGAAKPPATTPTAAPSAATVPSQPVTSPAPPTPPPEALAKPQRNLRVIDGGLRADTPFDQLLELLSQPVPVGQPVTQAALEADDHLLGAVRAHFEQNRPAPTALPAASVSVLNAVTQPDLSLSELTRLVAQDPAMAAGLLKVANSVAYQAVQEIHSLRDAVTRLGLTEVSRVAASLATRSLYQPGTKGSSPFEARWSELFADAVTTARAAAWQAMHVKGTRSDHAFLAGMLHDLGRPFALRSLIAVVTDTKPEYPVDDARADRVLEAAHTAIGTWVHTEWALPQFAAVVAARHHELNLPADAAHRDLHVVRLASAMVQFRRQSWRVAAIRAEINESAKVLGLDGFALRSLDTRIREELVHVAQAFGADPRRRTA